MLVDMTERKEKGMESVEKDFKSPPSGLSKKRKSDCVNASGTGVADVLSNRPVIADKKDTNHCMSRQ